MAWLSSNGKSVIGFAVIKQQSLGDREPEADSASLSFFILWKGVGKERSKEDVGLLIVLGCVISRKTLRRKSGDQISCLNFSSDISPPPFVWHGKHSP